MSIRILCAICKVAEARWKCLVCDKLAICDGVACATKHAETCPPSALRLEDASTIQLLEAAPRSRMSRGSRARVRERPTVAAGAVATTSSARRSKPPSRP